MFQLSNALSFNYFSKSYLQNYKSNNFSATIFEFFSAPEETELFYIECMSGCCSVIFENVKNVCPQIIQLLKIILSDNYEFILANSPSFDNKR